MNEQALRDRLKNAAKTLGLGFNEVWHNLVMERFLVRISMSQHRDAFIFKGGFLLAQYLNLGRETRDLDFLLRRINAEKSNIERALSEIAAINTGDDFQLSLQSLEDLPHNHMKYPGFRGTFLVNLNKMKEIINIDIGIGDAVTSIESNISLTKIGNTGIFEDKISLFVYPPETIFAEKLQTAVMRAEQNSRMKDYYDLHMLIESKILHPEKTKKAIFETFTHRETPINGLPINFTQVQITSIQKYWINYLRGFRSKNEPPPKEIETIIKQVNQYLEQIGIIPVKIVLIDKIEKPI